MTNVLVMIIRHEIHICFLSRLPHFYANAMNDSPEYGAHFRPKEWAWDKYEQHYHYL